MVETQVNSADLQRFIEDSKQLIGQEAPDIPQGIRQADWSSIQRFCAALGDKNPIYNDTAGGVGTAYNTLIAPPAFILSVRTPDSGAAYERKAYGLRRFSIRASAEWSDVIRMAERLVSDIEVAAVREGGNWGDRPTAEVDSTATYSTLNGAVFAKATGSVALVPYQLGDPLILDRDIHRFSEDEVRRLEDDLDAVPPHRGEVPLYWSELNEGDKVPTLVKGPLYYNEMAAWRLLEHKPAAIDLGTVAHQTAVERPGRITVNPSTQWPYFDVEQAYGDILSVQALGFKMPVSRGLMRFACAAQLLTNWMGDLGFLRKLTVDLPNHFCYQDTMWLSGEVVKKYKETVGSEEYHALDIRVSGHNQLGETLVDGTAVVYLPEKGFLVGLPVGDPWW